jgi:hypothetical protein
MQVKEFAQNNTPFSVHDITRSIRSKTANGELEIPEVEVTGASFRFDIPHAKVKALFDELWRTGVFDPDFSLSRQFNGMYFLYTPTAVGGTSYAGVSVAPQPTPTPAPTPSAPVTPVVTNVNDGAAIEPRVKQYLTNCTARNFRPTLKQVQSAIKRGDVSTGWSCDDLKEMVQRFGYSVVDNPDNVSKAQVVTV